VGNEFLRKVDFAGAFKQLPRENRHEARWLSSLGLNIKPGLKLTSEEEFFLSTFFALPSQSSGNVETTVRLACAFEHEHGRLPVDGIELFNWFGPIKLIPLIEGASWDDHNLSPGKRLSAFPMLLRVVNPATGRVYSTFQESSGAPFGVHLRKTGTESTVKLSDLSGGDVRHIPAVDWEVTIYGSAQDRVLIQFQIQVESNPEKLPANK
jgi:hypothetical protein